MPQGQGSITIIQKRIPAPAPGPPFVATSADNGLSVDPVTGRIVLGNDFFGSPDAMLLSTREIPLNGFQLFLTDTNSFVQFNSGTMVLLDTLNSNRAEIAISTVAAFVGLEADSLIGSPPEVALFDIAFPGSSTRIQHEGNEFKITPNNILTRMISLDQSFGSYHFGDIDGGVGGWYLSIEALTGNHEIRNDTTGERIQLWDTGAGQVITGDVANLSTGMQELIDLTTSTHDVSNTGNTAIYSINGNPGVSGTFTPPASITVEGGIITAIS